MRERLRLRPAAYAKEALCLYEYWRARTMMMTASDKPVFRIVDPRAYESNTASPKEVGSQTTPLNTQAKPK
jgi:hypothetical protein